MVDTFKFVKFYNVLCCCKLQIKQISNYCQQYFTHVQSVVKKILRSTPVFVVAFHNLPRCDCFLRKMSSSVTSHSEKRNPNQI
jgi:hypothetical protein